VKLLGSSVRGTARIEPHSAGDPHASVGAARKKPTTKAAELTFCETNEKEWHKNRHLRLKVRVPPAY